MVVRHHLQTFFQRCVPAFLVLHVILEMAFRFLLDVFLPFVWVIAVAIDLDVYHLDLLLDRTLQFRLRFRNREL